MLKGFCISDPGEYLPNQICSRCIWRYAEGKPPSVFLWIADFQPWMNGGLGDDGDCRGMQKTVPPGEWEPIREVAESSD